VNFQKSAIIDLFSCKTSYKHLSDEDTIWIKNQGTELKLNIDILGATRTITLPLVTEYKYLGVKISRDLTPHAHLNFLNKKINYLVNAFKSIGGSSQNLKFCVNTWHVFIRPLLDYCQTYFYFVEPRHREKLHTLYRESLRKMAFLKSYTPTSVVEQLIQYDYKHLHEEYFRVANEKIAGRQSRSPNVPNLLSKIDFNYKRIDLTDIPLIWSKIWNIICYPIKDQINVQPIVQVLEEIKETDLVEFMNNFLVRYVSKTELSKLYKLYNVLLSIL
jgi:hypothetical protein